jgi:DNA polymerase-1
VRDDLFLIDSTFLLEGSAASFLGAPSLVDAEGRDHTQVFGVAREFLKLRRKLGIRRATIIVGRESVAATSEAVLADLLALLAQLKVTVLRDDGACVVDICARYADEARWIVSAKWALSQLITEDLGLFIPMEGGDVDSVTAESLSSIGIRPDQVPSLLALSENKEAPLKRPQAIRLLELYGTLEAALADVSSAPSADWKRKLAPRKDALLQRMAEIQVRPATRARQPQNLDGAFIDLSKESAEALQRHGFWSLIRLLPLPAATDCAATIRIERQTDYKAIRNAADLRVLEQCLSNAEVCAIDTETTGKDPRTATLLGIALSVREAQAFFVPMMKPDLDGLSPDEVHTRLKKLLTRRLNLIGHNLKYDLAVLRYG